jgi:hypothetical protein
MFTLQVRSIHGPEGYLLKIKCLKRHREPDHD